MTEQVCAQYVSTSNSLTVWWEHPGRQTSDTHYRVLLDGREKIRVSVTH